MTSIKFGLNRFDFSSLESFAADVRTAEELGWDIAFALDSQLALRDPYVMLTYAAHATSTIGLGTLITNPVTRHPTVTASSFATIDELSGGRASISGSCPRRPRTPSASLARRPTSRGS